MKGSETYTSELHRPSTEGPSLLWGPTLNAESPTIRNLGLPQVVFRESGNRKKYNVAYGEVS